jgi:F420-dependent oxidoreductase-like protein
MQFGAQLWSQQTSWPQFRDAAVRAENVGWASVWTWDHLLAIFGPWEQPILEGWMTLSATAAVTSRIRLGLMVGANTFRNPALVAKMITTLDHISGGRAYLGIGGAWFETEHTAFGIPYGRSPGERLNWFDEAVELMRGMLHEEETSARGRFYEAQNVRNNPPPLQESLPILIGGSGERKTLHTVAKYADAWNTGGDLERVRHKDEVLRRWCEEVGRDESEIERTLQGGSVVIRDTVEEAKKAGQAIAEHNGLPDFRGPAETAEMVAERLLPQIELGFHHVYFDCPAPYDRETLERLMSEVKPLLERAVAKPTA